MEGCEHPEPAPLEALVADWEDLCPWVQPSRALHAHASHQEPAPREALVQMPQELLGEALAVAPCSVARWTVLGTLAVQLPAPVVWAWEA